MRPHRHDEHGTKTDKQRLWQVLTMREGKIICIQDPTDQATALQRPGYPPAHKGSPLTTCEVSTPDLRGLVLAGNVTARRP